MTVVVYNLMENENPEESHVDVEVQLIWHCIELKRVLPEHLHKLRHVRTRTLLHGTTFPALIRFDVNIGVVPLEMIEITRHEIDENEAIKDELT